MIHMLNGFIRSVHVSTFTMEIALSNEIHTYSGRLGVLAGAPMRDRHENDSCAQYLQSQFWNG